MAEKGIWPLILLGFPSLPIALSSNVTDDMGLLEMLTLNIDYFKSKPVNIPYTMLWGI
jgi:hypothetical protein